LKLAANRPINSAIDSLCQIYFADHLPKAGPVKGGLRLFAQAAVLGSQGDFEHNYRREPV
jgi:hypothetical protein